MNIEYKMVQVPPAISVDAKKHKGNEAATFLAETVNREGRDGWQFYRVDSIGVYKKQGCWGSLMMRSDEYHTYNVITFRRGIDIAI